MWQVYQPNLGKPVRQSRLDSSPAMSDLTRSADHWCYKDQYGEAVTKGKSHQKLSQINREPANSSVSTSSTAYRVPHEWWPDAFEELL